MKKPASSGGHIVTFYSYKGGTGRSMALANVAWILASAGKRVLVVDWDLEAPGLHRYLRPFLEDSELETTPGLIDLLSDFTTAARVAVRADEGGPLASSTAADGEDPPWYEPFTCILSYACPVQWEFPEGGALDLMPAGRQDSAYPLRVTSFDWQEFYDTLGGGLFLEALKRQLREDYDWVLIDSRTGIADTAGICTVQMPDSLVVCFTLNRQSISGAGAVAASAEEQRRRPRGEPGIRIWPVATRIELAEKERLAAARDIARQTFHRHLRMKRGDRTAYWGETEILYQPYFAYEEVLAVFVEHRGQSGSMLGSMEALTRHLTDGQVTRLSMSVSQRDEGLQRSQEAVSRPRGVGQSPLVYLSYPATERKIAQTIVARLDQLGLRTWWDRELLPGDDWDAIGSAALDSSQVLIVVVGGELRRGQSTEVERALERGLRIVPVIPPGRSFSDLPVPLSRLQAILLDESSPADGIEVLASSLERLTRRAEQIHPVVAEDPQKGQWGGRSEANGRRVSAKVRRIDVDWFLVRLVVQSSKSGRRLAGAVDFHLHPTFQRDVVTVEAKDGRAELEIQAWGAFTVGVSADRGATRLEIDLAEDSTLPAAFRSR